MKTTHTQEGIGTGVGTNGGDGLSTSGAGGFDGLIFLTAISPGSASFLVFVVGHDFARLGLPAPSIL